MDNMNFNQDDIFKGPLFGNNNYDIPNDSNNELGNFNQNDLPPELGEIKNLSDATLAQAPTMDALEPANFTTENQTLVSDPLDLYENKGIVSNENQFEMPTSQDYSNLNTNDINQMANDTFTNLGYNENSVNEVNLNNISNFGLNDKSQIDYNTSVDFNSSENVAGSNSFDFSSNITSYESTDNQPNFDTNFSNNLTGVDNELNKNDNDSKDFEILNKSLSTELNENQEENDKSTELSDNIDTEKNYNFPDFTSVNDTLNEEISANNIINEEKSSLDDMTEEEVDLSSSKEIEESSNEGEEITDISSLGIDDVYTEPDSLEIMDTELLDEEDDTVDEKVIKTDENVNSIDSIKNLVEELKSKGQNIKLEEFDFETMHQLIIIVEK